MNEPQEFVESWDHGMAEYFDRQFPAPTRLARKYFGRSFFHYLWTGGAVTALQVFFLWLFIDVGHVHTVIASVIVTGSMFILRYALLRMIRVIS